MTNITNTALLHTHGYQIIKSDNIKELNNLKTSLSEFLKEKYSFLDKDPNYILNNIHKIANINSDDKANDLVLDVIRYFSKKADFAEIAFSLFKEEIYKILGPDLHAQRNNNIVFQYPNSSRYSELHTDSPPNSPYEIVFWIPLVDCYQSKSFFVLPINDSKKLIKKFNLSKFKNWDEFKQEALKKACHLKVDYSEAIVFWTGIMHGSLNNQTKESRWCMNVRFKNLFAPCGQNDPLTYYRVFRTSGVSKLAFDHI